MLEAMRRCHPDDAMHIAAAAVEALSAGSPLPSFIDVMEDARYWASMAAPHEIEAYFIACGSELAKRPLNQTARKRVFIHLWQTFSKRDQTAFIEKFRNKVRKHGL